MIRLVVLAALLGTLPGWIARRKGRCFVDWWLYGMALFAVALPHALLVRASPAKCIYKGVFLLATGRAAGMDYFASAPERFVASLAPLVLLPLFAAGLFGFGLLANGTGQAALVDSLGSVCAMLVPPVLSFEIAARWGRGALWLRFATAGNWCQWALVPVVAVLALLVGALGAIGLPDGVATVLLVASAYGYGLWLNWFVARVGLDLSARHAALLVAGVNLVTVALVFVPRLLVLALGGSLAGG
jgi:hypothetical protein